MGKTLFNLFSEDEILGCVVSEILKFNNLGLYERLRIKGEIKNYDRNLVLGVNTEVFRYGNEKYGRFSSIPREDALVVMKILRGEDERGKSI